MWVAVDIDNTICNTNLELVRMFGISLKKYPAPEVPPDIFTDVDFFRKIEPFPEARDTLQLFANLGYSIAYISSRPVEVFLVTMHWLKMHNFPRDSVICSLTKEEKVAMVERLNAIAYFEDDPSLVRPLLNKVPALWLKDWPYNRKLPLGRSDGQYKNRVIRFSAWQEVKRVVIASNPDLAALCQDED